MSFVTVEPEMLRADPAADYAATECANAMMAGCGNV